MRRATLAALAVGAVSALVLLGGCGVPAEESATQVGGVPEVLVASTTTTSTTRPPVTTTVSPTPPSTVAPTTTVVPSTTTSSVPAPPTAPVGLYYVLDTGLARVVREVPIASTALPVDPMVVLRELERGPQTGDGVDLHSALPAGQVQSISTNRGLATVALAPSFRSIENQQLAIAQIVLTLTERGVGLVQFTIDGNLIPVPIADLSQAAGPVAREDYSALVVGAADRTPNSGPPPIVSPPSTTVPPAG